MNEVKRVVEIMETRTPTVMSVPQPPSETAAILHMIERAARDPAVDITKLQQLLELRTKIEEREAARQFDEAMADAQSEMRPVVTDANNPQTRSKYASYVALDRALRPVYSKHRFGVSFNTGKDAPEGYVRVLAAVTRGAHTRDYHIDMPADGKGAKGGDVMTKTHATGAGVTYGRRYLLGMIFNLVIGEDNDGNAPDDTGPSGPITQDQLATLISLADEVGADKERFCKYMKCESFASIPASQFKRATDALNAKRKQQ